jgi:hypothetical protein
LDPDNGLGHDEEHVQASELLAIWNRLRREDLIIFYQHAHRDKQWLETRYREFEHALPIPAGTARIARGAMVTRRQRFCGDTALFFVQMRLCRRSRVGQAGLQRYTTAGLA